jgi:hypothetical protein
VLTGLATIVCVLAVTGGTAYASAGPAPTPMKVSPSASRPATVSKATSTTKPSDNAASSTKRRAAVGKAALAGANVPNTCSGAIQPDTIYPCSSLPAGATNTYTFDLAKATDLVFVAVTATDGESLPVSVTGPGDAGVNCQFFGLPTFNCATTVAGTYTLQVQSAGTETGYTIAYTPLLSDASCTAITDTDLSFASPPLAGALAAGSSGTCYTLNQPAGTVMLSLVDGNNVTASIYDASGTLVCGAVGNCTLTGTSPYRAMVEAADASAVTYQWGLFRLSNATGCVSVDPQPYGIVPDTSSINRCRSLHVTQAGFYQVQVVTADGSIQSGTVYDVSGTQVCSSGGGPCNLPAGNDALILVGPLENRPAYGVIFIAGTETRGCAPVSDTGFVDGAATGSFTGTEKICLSLSTPSGMTDSIFNGLSSNTIQPDVLVIDATGAQVCHNFDFGFDPCKLTGPAPFNIVLSSGPGAYQILVQRANTAAGCTIWPQSGYGGTPGLTVTLQATFRAACLSIPANQHATGEMIDFANTENVPNASVVVLAPDGTQVCTANSLGFCSLTSGVAYTAILSSPSAVDTYQLVRRDLSQSATCSSPTATAPAGPSNTLTLTSALDARCTRMTAAATDDLLMGVRTAAGPTAGAVLFVANNAGKLLCRQFGVPCRVNGSTSYQVIVVALNFAGTPITAHLDTWRVATSTGFVSQCTAHQVGPDGFAPFSTILTESQTAYCAVVSVRPSEAFGVYGVTSAPRPGTPWIIMAGSSDWTNGGGYCGNLNFGDLSFQCQVPPTSPGQAVMIVYPYTADLPLSLSLQGFCESSCVTPPAQTMVTAVSPNTGQAGQVGELTLSGTGLTMGDQVSLVSNGSSATQGESTPVLASAGGTSMTVQVSLFGVGPGTYDVKVTSPTFSTATLPGAYHVVSTATPDGAVFKPITPNRILDTRIGLGAPKARVGAGGVVRLQVTGRGGVPSTGVTAVVMNVTAVQPTSAGYVTAYPDGEPVPTVSSVNFAARQTLPNLVTVPVVNGKVDLRNAHGSVDLLADVSGYYTNTTTGSELTTVGPTRILDTRIGLGAAKAKVAKGATLRFHVTGHGGVPSSGVTAVAMNVTVVRPASGGYVTVYPDGQPRPTVSNLNFVTGQTVPNLVIVPVVNGVVDFFNGGGATDLLADVTGYFSTSGAGFRTVTPVRLMDTRIGLGIRTGAIGPGGTLTLPVIGGFGVPSTGVTAVVLNVTVTGPTASSFLTAFPDGQPRPTVSNLNFVTGQTISNQVIVPVVNGKIDFYNSSGTVQVIADLSGYFVD